MKEEIYIKGEPIDLGDSQITLNFKSNLLGDISKITSSNSYTIEIPRTIKNERLLEFPDVAGHDNYLMRDYFNAIYYRNDVKMFEAKAVLTGCTSEKISIVLTWGIDEKLINIINDEKSIQEFAYEALYWGQNSKYDYGGVQEGLPVHGYIPMNTGVDVDSMRDKIFVHPSASVYQLLDAIKVKYDIDFIFPNTDIKDEIDLLYIPLVTQKADPKYNFFTAKLIETYELGIKLSAIQYIDGVYLSQGESLLFPFSIFMSNTSHKWRMAVNVKWSINSGLLHVVFAQKDYSKIYDFQINADANKNVEYEGTIPFDISQYQEIRVILYIGGAGDIDYNYENTISFIDEDLDSISYGQYYPIGANLPDIKVIDFIKQICWLFGLFAIKSNEGEIKFISVDSIIQRKIYSKDWSDKLIVSGVNAKETSYKFGDYAQKNYLRYKENENSKIQDGYIEINDKTLDLEKDLIEMPYQKGGDKGDMSSVPYFKLSSDGQNVELISCGDRIMKISVVEYGKDPRLSFKDLSSDNIIRNYYSSYIELVNDQFVIKDNFRLTEIDLKNLDFTTPVYIRQYGAFFAIISIKTQGEISEVELLKLK